MNHEQIATLAGGCFWCTEAVFSRVRGVKSVIPGYTGGSIRNPSYEQVCSGQTGHVEAIQVTFDATIITFEKILDIFFATHDPTTPDRQGADIGPEYASIIFYHSEEQKHTAVKKKSELEKSGIYKAPIVTKILPAKEFYPAENYHRDYYEKHSSQPYCQIIIDPKIQKLLSSFPKEASQNQPVQSLEPNNQF